MRAQRLPAALVGPVVLLFPLVAGPAAAGPVNPDISVVGQPFARWTNDAEESSKDRLALDPGEVELLFDAYLNPYARGLVIVALGDEGAEVEEGYFSLVRGLPGGLALKAGKYRVDFGKMNLMHGHALPFAERPRVLAAYLPGEESLNETGVSLSERIPLPGTFSLTAAVDLLQGDSFRVEREASEAPDDPLVVDADAADRADEARPAFAGHLSGFGQIGERSGVEVALSAAGGTNNVAARTRTMVYATAAKAKLWTAPQSYLLLQGEVLKLDREDALWDEDAAAYASTRTKPLGGYVYADYAFSPRWDAGLFAESYEQPGDADVRDNAFGAFVGLSLMEETTSFRLDWNRLLPGAPDGAEDPDPVDTLTLRAIFSMGPHKAHQF